MSTIESSSALSQMTTVQFLSYLHGEDIEIWPEGDRLRFSAPVGGLRPELRAELARRKQEVLELLHRSALTSGPEMPLVTPIPHTGPLPLSFAQERLWFLDQYEPFSPLYTISPAYRLRGDLRVDVLARSLAEILRRHEVLRMTFAAVDGRPVPVIARHLELALPVIDLRDLPAAERDERAGNLGNEMACEPFDLARGPLLRTCLLRLGDSDWLFFLTVHHIVFDGWSSGILTRELLALYQAFAAGLPSPLSPLPVQYVDFAAWQRGWLTGERMDAELAHWRRRIGGAARLELPTDRPRSVQTGYRGAALPIALDADLAAALRSLGQREDATLFMVLLAAFQALLALDTGQDDVSVGSVVAGRSRREVEDLIGFFINTLVLRTDLAGSPGFSQLLARARSVAMDALAHQDFPFERLVEALQPERRAYENPLFQVLFVLQNAPAPAVELPGLVLTVLERRSDTAKFDLTMTLAEGPAGLAGSLEYNTDLFDRSTVARFACHLEELLRGAVADPGRPLPEISRMPEPERHQVLREWNARLFFPAPLPLHELFAAQAARTPDAVALCCEGAAVSYAALYRAAVRLARRLVDLGLEPEAPVGLCAERSPELVAGLLGILMAGGAYVPLDPTYPRERLALVVEDVRPAVVLAESRLLPRLPAVKRTLELDDAFHGGDKRTPPAVAVSPDQVAYVIYTSGSTGRPKGTPVTHRNVARLFTATERWFDFGAGDVWTLFHSFAFDFSVWEIWGALLYGGRLVVVSQAVSREPESFYRLLCEEGVTVLNQTPSAFHLLVRAEQELGGPELALALRWVIFGGEALDLPSLAPWFAAPGDRRSRLVNMYGITETTVHVSFRPIAAADLAEGHRSPIGVAIPDLSVHLLDSWGQPVPAGVHGEIHVGGDGLGRGYLGRPDLTAQRFVPDPFAAAPGSRRYRSGDLARATHRGEIEYLGRMDHQIKIRGFRVEPGEVEAAVSAQPGVAECAVVVRDYGDDDRRLVACVVPTTARRDAPDRLLSALREALKRRLPEYLVPAHYVLLDALPLTPSGKVDRRALRRLAETQSATPSREGSDLPQQPVEELLARIYEEVLRVERVGRDGHFFDLGGHSLLATQVISRVRETFQVELPVLRLFEVPTVAGLAGAIQESLRATLGLELPPIQPAPRDRHLPLSFAQQRLWVLHQFDPASPTYNMPAAVRLLGELDPRLLEGALRGLVRRHEVLRTCFAATDGQPVQVIAEEMPLLLPIVDLRALPPARRRAEARRRAAAEARRPFDLTVGPLVRATLLRMEAQESWALMTLHHIVSDGWSMGLFLSELGALYQAALRREPAPLPPLPVQYADFASWQNRWMTGELLRTELAWWKERLAGAPTNLSLSTDRPRPAVLGSRGGSRSISLSPALASELGALSRRQGATLFMTLLAALGVLLGRSAGQSDLLLGSPIAGRNRKEIEGLIGFFVNTLVLRCDLSGRPSFEQALGRVRRMALDAYAHQELPFERLVEDLVPERDLSRTPLFQVMFALQNAPAATLQLPNLVLESMELASGTAKFDLTLSLSESARGLTGSLEHNLDLFDTVSADRLIIHLGELLAAAVHSPGIGIWDLPLLGESERHQVVVEWNATAADVGETCLHRLVETQAERSPEAVALFCEGSSLSYRELERRSNRMAHRLRSLGVGPESVVGLCGERSHELVIGMLGILKAGGAYLPLDPDYPRERLLFLLEDARPPVVLVQPHLQDRLPEVTDTRLEWLDMAGEEKGWSDARPETVQPDNAVYVIYTSGSTGRPKGVVNSHRGIVNRLLWIQQAYPMRPQESLLQKTPFSFDVSVGEFFWPLVTGTRLVLAKPGGHLDNGYLTRTCIAEEVTHAHFVPSMLHLFLEENGLEECRPLRLVMCSGEALPVEPVRQFFQQLRDPLRVQLLNLYGPTEAAVEVTGWRCWPEDGERAIIPIGWPIANTQIRILDAERNPSPIGVPGELNIGGVNLARGYLDRPDLTAEKFVPDPFSTSPQGARLYRTGDLARVLPGGPIEFLGRVDHQIKIRGLRIEPGEIEAVLGRHSDVDEAAVVVEKGSGSIGHRLIAFYSTDREELSTNDLDEFLRGYLPAYMVPSAFIRLERLPLNANGKLDRRALAAIEVKWETEADFVTPRTRTELELQRIWEDVLHVRPIGVTENFFKIGGHSLLGIYVMVCIRERFGRDLPVPVLFRAPTIEGLAAVLEQDLPPSPYPSLVSLEPGGGKRPFFCVHGAGGNVFYFVRLAKRLAQLDPGRPFYGLQAQGLDAGQEHLTSIEAMAELYVEAIRSVQPEGPYLLGGYSMGGLVAYEMARRLQADCQEVALLALLDTLSGLGEQLARRDRAEVLVYFAGELSIPLSADELEGLEPDAQLVRVLEKGWGMKRIPREFTLADARRYFAVMESTVEASRQYTPSSYPGRLVLFRSQEMAARGAEIGWTGEHEVDTFLIPGGHRTIFEDPNVDTLGELLQACLDRADRET